MRGHIDGAANTGFEHLGSKIIHILGKPKIGNLKNSFIDENVGRFEISMDDFLFNKFIKATKELLHDLESFLFFETFSFDEFL